MIYKEYGKLGINVSAVGFGGMQFDISNSREKNADLVQYAYEKGINFLDTAPTYNEGQSEEIYGIFCERFKNEREKYYINTKCMPEVAKTKREAIAAVEKSLSRLKCDYIDFFYTWCIRQMNEYRMSIVEGGFYEGLLECKERGLIKHLTISSHLQGNELKSILEEGKYEGVLLGVNVLNFPFRWEAVQSAYERGYGVVAMNPLAGGAIPKNEKSLAFLAENGETPTEAALRFCISCPQITVTLNGFTTKEHIDTACKVADNAKPFSSEQIEKVRINVGANMNAICTGCGYCLKGCPKDIPISKYLQVYNETIIQHKNNAQMIEGIGFQHSYGLLADIKANATDCIKCGLCEKACTQHLNIIERLEKMAEYEEKFQQQNANN